MVHLLSNNFSYSGRINPLQGNLKVFDYGPIGALA